LLRRNRNVGEVYYQKAANWSVQSESFSEKSPAVALAGELRKFFIWQYVFYFN
jgi:hypothetical protein